MGSSTEFYEAQGGGGDLHFAMFLDVRNLHEWREELKSSPAHAKAMENLGYNKDRTMHLICDNVDDQHCSNHWAKKYCRIHSNDEHCSWNGEFFGNSFSPGSTGI